MQQSFIQAAMAARIQATAAAAAEATKAEAKAELLRKQQLAEAKKAAGQKAKAAESEAKVKAAKAAIAKAYADRRAAERAIMALPEVRQAHQVAKAAWGTFLAPLQRDKKRWEEEKKAISEALTAGVALAEEAREAMGALQAWWDGEAVYHNARLGSWQGKVERLQEVVAEAKASSTEYLEAQAAIRRAHKDLGFAEGNGSRLARAVGSFERATLTDFLAEAGIGAQVELKAPQA